MKICSIVVTYNPNKEKLEELLAAISLQVQGVIVVDNCSEQDIQNWLPHRSNNTIFCHRLDQNCGIGAAQNIGINWAKRAGFSHVLLMDQDSIPGPDMVKQLVTGITTLRNKGKKVAAVGPRVIDPQLLSSGYGAYRGNLSKEEECSQEQDNIVPVNFLISSGSLIPLSMIEQIGSLSEDLFLDNTDLEWCFCAQTHGFRVFMINHAELVHSLGEGVIRIRFLPRFSLIRHDPKRLYYIMRNRVLLYKHIYTPTYWIYKDFPRMIGKFFLFSVFIAPRRQHAQMMLKGIWHGIKGKSGKYA